MTKEKENPTPPEDNAIDPLKEIVEAVEDAFDDAKQARRKLKEELYGEEEFQDEGLNFSEDLSAYDQAAYTRTKEDLSGYRYNLQNEEYRGGSHGFVDDYDDYDDGQGSLFDDPGVAEDPDAPVTTTYLTGGTGVTKTKNAYGGYSYNYGLSDNAYNYSGGWMSSWYSGYSSVERAISGVHSHVATFIENGGYGALEIIPDLERPEGDLTASEMSHLAAEEKRHQKKGYASLSGGYRRYGSDVENSLAIRIDSSLYEKLGISEAQQHYIVDGIAQVLANQACGDPGVVTYIHDAASYGYASDFPTEAYVTYIPNVLRELITELMRAQGVPMLLDRMPGWQKRVTAFRSVMYIGEPPNNDIPTAYLMYAIWERDVVESLEHEDAVEVIKKIEDILAEPILEAGTRNYARVVHSQRKGKIGRIESAIIDYITSFGEIGKIVSKLRETRDVIDDGHKNGTTPILEDPDDINRVKVLCEELEPLVHGHNNTFCPDPKKYTVIKHSDYPDCPDKSMLPPAARKRVELSRKCMYNLRRIPVEVVNIGPEDAKGKYVKMAIKRIDDMLGALGSGGQDFKKALLDRMEQLAKKSRAAFAGTGGKLNGEHGSDGDDSEDAESGVNCTNHPELRSRAPVSTKTNRTFGGSDPGIAERNIVVYDFTT